MMRTLNTSLTGFDTRDLFIVLLLIGVVLSNYVWLKMDGRPVEGHELLGLIPAVQAYKELAGIQDIHPKQYDHILGIYNGYLAYSPLSFLVVVLFYFLFGLQGHMVIMVNSVYIAVTLLCVYLIGKNIFNRTTGLLAAFILSSFPGFICFSREYWIEFGLMAYVCADLYFLLKTNFFENRKYSILLGASLALSFLHKYEFLPFVMGPLLLVIFKSGVLKDISKAKCSNKLTNLVLTCAFMLGFTCFWWVRYGKYILGHMFFSAFSAKDEMPLYLQNRLSAESLTFYFYSILYLIGSFLIILLLVAIFFLTIKSILRNKKRFDILYLMTWLTLPYIIFTFVKAKNASHMLSLLPSIAILICAGLYFMKNKAFKITLSSLIVIYGLGLHVQSFFYSRRIFGEDWMAKYSNSGSGHYIAPYNFTRFYPPGQQRVELAITQTLEYIKEDPRREKYPRVLAATYSYTLKNCIYDYYNLIGNYQFRFFSYLYKPLSSLSECDYIIFEKADAESIADMLSRHYEMDRERRDFKSIFKNGIGDFELVKTFKIPNANASLLIYKSKQ